MTELTPHSVQSAVRDLVLAEKTNLGIEVSTPVVYPDGDVVTIVVEDTKDGLLVHDAGFASMRLSQAGIHLSQTAVLRLKERALRYRCNFALGRVSSRADATSLGIVACLVANAARSVADYTLEIRQQLAADFKQILTEVLREIVGKRLRENEEVRGRSGRRYRLSAILLDPNEAKPINFVSARGPDKWAVVHPISIEAYEPLMVSWFETKQEAQAFCDKRDREWKEWADTQEEEEDG